MSHEEEFRALAARYLDLWERQFTSVTTDPAVTALMESWFDALRRSSDELTGSSAGSGSTAAADRSAPAAAASVGGDHGMDEFARRLAELESRVDALEARRRRRKPSEGGS